MEKNNSSLNTSSFYLLSTSLQQFPDITYKIDPTGIYSDNDKAILEFIVHSALREYHNQLEPWDVFSEAHRIKEFVIQPSPIPQCPGYNGLTEYQKDCITCVTPAQIPTFYLSAVAYTITHEIAHYLICKYYRDSAIQEGLCYSWANKLVHYATNSAEVKGDYTYLIRKYFWSPLFFKRYGFPSMTCYMFNIKKLIEDRTYILDQIDRGLAPIGKDQYI